MAKPTVTKLFFGSLIAIVGGAITLIVGAIWAFALAGVLLELSGSYVFVVDDKNIAKRRLVQTGLSDDMMIEIVTEGSTLISRGVEFGEHACFKAARAIEAPPILRELIDEKHRGGSFGLVLVQQRSMELEVIAHVFPRQDDALGGEPVFGGIPA